MRSKPCLLRVWLQTIAVAAGFLPTYHWVILNAQYSKQFCLLFFIWAFTGLFFSISSFSQYHDKYSKFFYYKWKMWTWSAWDLNPRRSMVITDEFTELRCPLCILLYIFTYVRHSVIFSNLSQLWLSFNQYFDGSRE